MIERVIYEAEDGTEFPSAAECKEYETKLIILKNSNVRFLNTKGEEISINDEDFASEITYIDISDIEHVSDRMSVIDLINQKLEDQFGYDESCRIQYPCASMFWDHIDGKWEPFDDNKLAMWFKAAQMFKIKSKERVFG